MIGEAYRDSVLHVSSSVEENEWNFLLMEYEEKEDETTQYPLSGEPHL